MYTFVIHVYHILPNKRAPSQKLVTLYCVQIIGEYIIIFYFKNKTQKYICSLHAHTDSKLNLINLRTCNINALRKKTH